MEASYLPPLGQRIKELWKSFHHVKNPPLHKWVPGDVLVVLGAIEAYRCMYTSDQMTKLIMLIQDARDHEVPIVFTRCCRTDNSRGDAVDQKGHWSEYVPPDQTHLFHEIAVDEDDVVASVTHTNALTHPRVRGLAEECQRLVLAGCWTESCVANTAHAACEFSHHASPVIVADATTGHSPVHTYTLVRLQLYCADIVRGF